MAQLSDNVRGAALMAASLAFFTFNDACMKMLSGNMPLFETMLLRGIFVCVMMFGLAVYLRKLSFRMSRRDLVLSIVRAGTEALSTFLFVTAYFNMELANATAILQVMPLAVTLAAVVFLKEPIGWHRLIAIVVGFAGVMLIVRPGMDGFNEYSIYCLAAVITLTARDMIARMVSDDIPSMTVAFMGAIAVTVMGGVGVLFSDWVVPDVRQYAILFGAAVFIMLAYLTAVMTMRVGEVSFTTPFRYTGLLWALLLGYLVFGEWPDTWTLIGSAIVVAMGIFTLYREGLAARKARRQAKSMA